MYYVGKINPNVLQKKKFKKKTEKTEEKTY